MADHLEKDTLLVAEPVLVVVDRWYCVQPVVLAGCMTGCESERMAPVKGPCEMGSEIAVVIAAADDVPGNPVA